uniref:BPI2 domain-containing protein n=2 Tax=Trichuris muris TaxID=70415 RepID=A0A5S6R187_TRIMR
MNSCQKELVTRKTGSLRRSKRNGGYFGSLTAVSVAPLYGRLVDYIRSILVALREMHLWPLLLLSALCNANEPGIRVLLTKTGIDEVLNTWKRMFLKRMAYSEPVKLRIYGLRDYIVINNLRAGRIAPHFELKASIEQGVGFRFSVNRMNIDYYGNLVPYSTQEQSVAMQANVPELSFDAVIKVDNANGVLTPKMLSCEASAPYSASLQFNGPIPRALHALSLLHPPVLQGFVERALCRHIATSLFPPFRSIFNMPAKKLRLIENYYLDYSLIGSPLIGSDFFETAYNGEVFMDRGFKHTATLAVQPPPFPADMNPSQHPAMVHILMSNYTLNTLLYSLYRAGKFNMAVNHKTSPDSFVNYLKTGCQESQICAGTIFPSLGDKYPNSTLDMQIKLHKAPTAVFKAGAVEIVTVSSMKGSVRSQRNRQYYFFSAQMKLVTNVKRVRLRHYYVDGDISFDQLELSNVQSDVPGIDRATMSFVVSYALDLLVKPDMHRKLKNGMKIPKTTILEMTNGLVTVQPDRLVVSFQLCHQLNCDRSTVGNARSAADHRTTSSTYDVY